MQPQGSFSRLQLAHAAMANGILLSPIQDTTWPALTETSLLVSDAPAAHEQEQAPACTPHATDTRCHIP